MFENPFSEEPCITEITACVGCFCILSVEMNKFHEYSTMPIADKDNVNDDIVE